MSGQFSWLASNHDLPLSMCLLSSLNFGLVTFSFLYRLFVLRQAHLTSCAQYQQKLAETEACFATMKSYCGTEKMPEGLEQKMYEMMAGGYGSRKA